MNAKLSLILREKMRKWMKEVMMKKKHDKWRRVHECQTFVDIKRKDEENG
jgi:hypothetical protein